MMARAIQSTPFGFAIPLFLSLSLLPTLSVEQSGLPLSTYTFSNGDVYVGEMNYGAMNGQGTYTFGNGDKYVGEFRDGKQNGQGTYTFANGNKFVGEFIDGKFNGRESRP